MHKMKTRTRMLSLIMSILLLIGCIPDMGLSVLAADDDVTDAEVTDFETTDDEVTDAIETDIEADDNEAGDIDGTDVVTTDDNAAELTDGLFGILSPDDFNINEYKDDNDPKTYEVWIGDVQITETNKDDVLGDGKVSFDPESHTLTLKNAVLDKISTKKEKGGAPTVSANICAREALIIKGSAKLTNGYTGITLGSLSAKNSLTIDADLDIEVVNAGITAIFNNLYIQGGNININSDVACIAGMYNNMIISGGKLKLKSGKTGIIGYGSLIINGAEIESEGSEGAIVFDGIDHSTIEIYSPSFIETPAGAKVAPVKVQDKDALGLIDASGNKVTNLKISTKSGVETVTVTFDLNGHGLSSILPRTIGKGDKVCKPSDPVDNGLEFDKWYTEAECTNEYDFNSPVNADMTLYAGWRSSWPDPIYGSGSPIDPIPTVIPGKTYDLYLVKGQKFNIGQGWYLDKEDEDYKSGKSVVSISKKGLLSVKKAGEATITCGEVTKHKIRIHATAPKFKGKTVKLTIEDPGSIVKETLDFDYDNKNKYDVLWYSSNPDVCTVNKGVVRTTGSKGTSKITAYINGCAFTCKVSVKEKAAADHREIHMVKGSTKTISIKGFKNPEWSVPANSNISFIKKNKIKAGDTPGKTTIQAYSEKLGRMYTIDVYVEDLTLSDTSNLVQAEKGKNKYKLTITAGEITQLLLSASQPIIMRSNKPDIAFVDDGGRLTARSAGKCKLTTRLDGKTITLNVEVKAAE